VDPVTTQIQEREPHEPTRAEPAEHPAAAPVCLLLGLVLFCVGVYYLFIAPAEAPAVDVMGQSVQVASMHRLAIGQACLVSGSIFLAALVCAEAG
jgi:hypothetical protein